MKTGLALALFFLVVFSSIASAATLTINYTASDAVLCRKYCVYKNQPQYTAGLAALVPANFSSSEMSMSAEITEENDDMYIILTKKDVDVSNREAFLKDATFSDLINPSFGFPIIDIFSVIIGLQYNSIYLVSSILGQGIGPGAYSLVFRNNGTIITGPGAGSTGIVVEVI
jgi:hypothetical protein